MISEITYRPALLTVPHRSRVRLLTGLCFVVLTAVSLQSWTSLRLGGFDLGIFDQAVRAYSRFEPPVSPIKNVHHEFPTDFTLLGDHFSPVLALLAPLYWVWDDPRMLLLAQAALFALGVPLIHRITRRELGDTRAADLAALVYALGYPLFSAARSGFHEVAFAVPLTLLLLDRARARRWAAVGLCAVGLVCTKEDLGLMVGVFGLVLIKRSRSARPLGIALAIAGPLVTLLQITVLIPGMGGEPGYYWNYSGLGPDAGGAAVNLVTDPLRTLGAGVDPPVKILLLLWLFGTLCLLPLGSATVWLAVPLLAERIFSDNGNHWTITQQYDAFLWPVLLVAAVETVARFRRRGTRPGFVSAVFCLGAAVPLGLLPLLRPAEWRPSFAADVSMIEAAERIPDGATVEADNGIAPRLTGRTAVVILDTAPRGADYVLVRLSERSFPFATWTEQIDRIGLLLRHGYVTAYEDDGAVLLRRVHVEPVPGERLPGTSPEPVRDVVPDDVGRNLFKG